MPGSNGSTLSEQAYGKRVFTREHFGRAVGDLIANRQDIRAAARGGRIDHTFAEKIMLAVTRVNGCRYCEYGHTQAALASGVSEDELARLLAQDVGSFPEEEAVALTFAQHYAESKDQPDPAAWERLVAYYGPDAARDILVYIRMITVGNLLGNTFDAFLSRLRGRPSTDTTLWDELFVLGVVVMPLLAILAVVGGGVLALARRILPST